MLSFFTFSLCQAGEFSCENISVFSRKNYTQISIPLPEEASYVVAECSTPPGILLNLYPLKIEFGQRKITVFDQFVREILVQKESENIVKTAIFLTTSTYHFNVSSQKKPKTLSVHISTPETPDVISEILPLAEKKEKDFISSILLKPEEKKGVYKIIIDPGHGGRDPGAIGPSGILEKDITLSIAKKLSELLAKNPELEVYLTRESDSFISLDERAQMANKLKGDIFVSIHVNAAWDMQARGVETFYNSHYPYGEGAEEVAIRENASFGSDKISFNVKNIIWDLIQNQFRQESRELAEIIQKEMAKTSGAPDRGVKSAPFYVLRGVGMPAVLVEVGFISNPWEERRLKNERFQENVALGIYNGILNYISLINKRLGTE